MVSADLKESRGSFFDWQKSAKIKVTRRRGLFKRF